jgi:hypothetical protein
MLHALVRVARRRAFLDGCGPDHNTHADAASWGIVVPSGGRFRQADLTESRFPERALEPVAALSAS